MRRCDAYHHCSIAQFASCVFHARYHAAAFARGARRANCAASRQVPLHAEFVCSLRVCKDAI
eukprot:3621257-Lingulodinium_polyedra.AAC.1